MKELSANDANILAILAEDPKSLELLTKLSDLAQGLGKALVTSKGSKKDLKIAEGMKDWVESNKKAVNKRRKDIVND